MNMYKKWSKRTLINHKNKGCEIKIKPKELSIIAMNTSFCQICNVKLDWFDKTKPNGVTLDRIDNELLIKADNIQIICKQCNNLKGNLPMNEFTKAHNMELFKKTLMNRILQNIKDISKTNLK